LQLTLTHLEKEKKKTDLFALLLNHGNKVPTLFCLMTSKERRKPNGRVRKININGELFTRKLTLRYFFCYYYILYYIIFCYCYYYQEKRYLLKENLHFLYHGIPDFDIV